MIAECRCQPDRGTCCIGCRSACELMLIALRLERVAPDAGAKVKVLAVELQQALVESRRGEMAEQWGRLLL